MEINDQKKKNILLQARTLHAWSIYFFKSQIIKQNSAMEGFLWRLMFFKHSFEIMGE